MASAHQSLLDGCTDGHDSADLAARLPACRAWRLSCSWPCPPPSACWCCADWRPAAPQQVGWAGRGAHEQRTVWGVCRQALACLFPGQSCAKFQLQTPRPACCMHVDSLPSALCEPGPPTTCACCIPPACPAAAKRQMVSFAVDQQTTLVESNDKPTVTPAMLAVSQQQQALLGKRVLGLAVGPAPASGIGGWG